MKDRFMEERVPKIIRQLRKAKNLTLEQLAQEVGCTKSFLSQVERGVSTPSLSMLGKIAGALEMQVSELFGVMEQKNINGWHLPVGKRRKISYPDGKIETYLLTKALLQNKMQPIISIIEPGASSDMSEMLVHPPCTDEFVLVLGGSIEFEISQEKISLQRGDTLYFNGELPHRWVNRSRREAEVLFVFSPPVW